MTGLLTADGLDVAAGAALPLSSPEWSRGGGRARARGRVGIGLTVKSGWAAMVLVRTSDRLELLNSTRVELSDPDVPESVVSRQVVEIQAHRL